MLAARPARETNLDGYGNPPLEWPRVMESLRQVGTLGALDPASRYWLATTRPDGRPHVMPVGAIWDHGSFFFTAGANTQKAKNLARNPHCVISVAAPGTDIVVEGEARHITDSDELQRVADLFPGWDPVVRDGAFWHDYSAPSAGPPPWDLYEITPQTVYGLATAEPYGATRWRL